MSGPSPARWRAPALRSALLAVCLAASALAASCSSARPSPATAARSERSLGRATVGSNVLFSDYAGTQACARCHASYVEQWTRSPMHKMTRDARGAEVRGPFDGTVFHFAGDTATLESRGADRFMTLASKRYGGGIYKITRVIGGHYREDYAGVPVAAVREGAEPLGDPTREIVLPVSFVYGDAEGANDDGGALRYKGYSVMVKERDGLKAGAVWNQTCIFCHNTVPYLSTALGALANAGGYQGTFVDRLLPPPMRATYAVTDPAAMERALRDELTRIGATSGEPTLRGAISATRAHFRAEHLVEIGIGCESCHLGAAEHARDPMRLPSFEPVSDAFEVRLPEREGADARAAAVNRACARCHQVLFSRYDPTWEGGSRRRSPGGSHINSGEARDLMLGACATKLSCVDCHDPHAPDGTARLRQLGPREEDALCTKCHEGLASDDALRAHSRHDPAGSGARCMSCHMPQKNMSLDGRLSRYHRVGSPTAPEKVLLDRPLECALCHADKSVGELVSVMESWWNKSYDRAALASLYGSLDANVLLATAARGKPHEQAVAFQLLGDAKMEEAVAVLKGQLTHPYPIVRGYAKRALDGIFGRPLDIDIHAPHEQITEGARRLR